MAVEEIKKQEKKENKEPKVELEREYIINLRRQVMKAQEYRRAKKAIRTIKEFLAKHMKVENRDLNKVKINKYLNEEVWFRGIKKPLMKVKVKAVKKDGIVYAELAEIPAYVKFKMQRDERNTKVDEKKISDIKKKEEEKKETKEETKDDKEKEQSTVEAGLKEQKREARAAKHEMKGKEPEIHRMTMQK